MPQLSPEQLFALRAAPVGENSPNRLRVAMALAGVRQEQIVSDLGISKFTLSRIVNGRPGLLDITIAQSLAKYFGCSTDELFPQGVAA